MGSMTDSNLAQFAEQTGIKPAIGRRAELLKALSDEAYELIKVVMLEQSGIRDGDGHWHGTDVVGRVYRDLNSAWHALQEMDHGYDLCTRCGGSDQGTHHLLCQARDGTPTEFPDWQVRELIDALDQAAERTAHEKELDCAAMPF